jgi:PPOX class probable F420-dependent enzyme
VPADIVLIRRLAAADHGLAVLATTRDDGSVHASLVNAGVLPDPVSGSPCVGIVVRSSARKLAYLRRRPRATVVFHAGWEWVAVDGATRILGPDDPLDAFDPVRLPMLLRDVFTAAGGSHDNWAEFDRVMADERRAGVFVSLDRLTTNG